MERGKGKEQASSEEGKNPHHRRKNWCEVVGGSPGQGEIPEDTVNPTKTINPKATYTGEEVQRLIAHMLGNRAAGPLEPKNKTIDGGWTE